MEGFLEEATADFMQPELSLRLKVLPKASLRQIARKMDLSQSGPSSLCLAIVAPLSSK